MKTKSDKKAMTPDEARSFGRYSLMNAAMAAQELVHAGACDGTCNPYEDIFTYRRWAAQGFQVQKGQHGAHLAIFVETAKTEKVDDGTEIVTADTRPWSTTVFCFHQVQPVEAKP